MIKVQLHDLQFKGFHGIQEEEKILGNDYIVNAAVEFHEHDEVIEHIGETVDYAIIYDIIKKRMSIPTALLETIVMQIGSDIHHQFSNLRSITVSLQKMHPPIEGIQGSAEVCWHKEF